MRFANTERAEDEKAPRRSRPARPSNETPVELTVHTEAVSEGLPGYDVIVATQKNVQGVDAYGTPPRASFQVLGDKSRLRLGAQIIQR